MIYIIGPGPLEALANGCVYIQPRFPSPINRMNNVRLCIVLVSYVNLFLLPTGILSWQAYWT